ncbi:MAG TPA: hypothetical protein PLL69_03010, partial [Gemmatimonadales bacterium]|nr:hypothetical protein [Gemmatimonadales bacterium]
MTRTLCGVAALLIVAGCGGSTTTPPDPPVTVTAVTVIDGNDQNGTVGESLDSPIRLRATDAAGNAAVGVELFLSASASGTAPSSTTTGSGGVAEVEWTLARLPGENHLEVRSRANGEVLAALTASGFPGLPTALTMVDGDGQSELPGVTLGEPLQVLVVDRFDNPVPGVPVDFEVIDGAGAVNPQQPLSDLDGVASADWTPGNTGTQRVRVSIPDSIATGV